jgi:molecular chaperone GrpE
MMNNKEYNRPLEFDIQQVKKRNNMKDKEEMRKYKELYNETVEDLNDYKNLYVRQRSEMENYSKYKEREIENIRKNASSGLIKELLPVLDTLDAGITHDPKLEPVRSQLLKVLQSYGLNVIDSKGKKYDPNLMEAIGVLDQGENGTVLEEVQKGYTLNGDVLRTSKVIVSKR